MHDQDNLLSRLRKQRFQLSGVYVFSGAIIFLFICSLCCNALTDGQIFENLFYKDRMDTAMDFFHSIVYVSRKTPYTQYAVVYPPLANFFFFIFAASVPEDIRLTWAESYADSILMRGTATDLRVSQYTLFLFLIYIVFLAVFTYFVISVLFKGTNWEKRLFAISFLCSTGFLFALERGNIVILAALLAFVFMRLKDSKNLFLSELGLISLAISAGLKIYPALLGIFLIFDKQYKKAFRGIIYGLLFFFVPFYFFEGTEAIAIFLNKLVAFSDSSGDLSITGYSLQQVIKPLLVLFGVENWAPYVQSAKYIGYVILLVSILVIPFASRWKTVGLLTMAMFMFPGKISSGTLSYLILPLAFFMTNFEQRTVSKWWYLVLYILVLGAIPFPSIPFFQCLEDGYSLNLFVIQMAELALLITYLLDCLAEATCTVKKILRSNRKCT